MATNYPQTTGIYSGRSITPRNVFKSGTPKFFPSFALLDGSKSRDTSNTDTTSLIQAGTILGKITSGGKYRPSVIGVLGTATTAATVTSVTVPAAVATEFARLIVLASGNVSAKLYGPPTAGGTNATTAITVTAASGTTLTVSSVTTPVHVVGSLITLADGSESQAQILTTPYGIDVLDITGNAVDSPVPLIRDADIDVTMIPYYSSFDASVKTAVKANLRTNNPGAVLTFSDDR